MQDKTSTSWRLERDPEAAGRRHEAGAHLSWFVERSKLRSKGAIKAGHSGHVTIKIMVPN